VQSLTTANLANLTTDDIQALTTTQVRALTSTQLRGLTSTNLQAMETTDLQALTTTQVQSLTTANLANLTTDGVQALTTQQVQSLTSTQLRGLTSTNLQAMETTDIQALTTTQVYHLSTTIITQITSAQLTAMTTSQLIALHSNTKSIAALTSSQTGSLTTCQLGALFAGLADPLILDLNGDGIHTTAVGSGVTFNFAGQKEATGWVGAGDGILVTDKDFGPNTLQGFEGLLPKGFSAVNGPTGMTAMDSNHDGVLNAKDAAFNDLEVYTFNNGVGKLQTLSELNIASIAVGMTEVNQVNNGNLVGLMGSYTTADGVTHSMADVMFQIAPVIDLERALRHINGLESTGHVDLNKAQTFKNLNVSLQDVLVFGEDLSGVHQLTIDGTSSDTLHLANAGSGGWHAAGAANDGGDSYMVYVNANAQLLVNDQIHIVIG
jgi:hypothetical protein